jgi:hypothetical protein
MLIGCSSSYTLSHYSTKDRFYRDFNNSVGDKDLKITLVNDSLYLTTGGGVIKHDTLYTPANAFPVENIKTINYTNTLITTIFGVVIGGLALTIPATAILVNNVNAFNFASAFTYYSIAMLSGCVLGGITGSYIGWDVIYRFN